LWWEIKHPKQVLFSSSLSNFAHHCHEFCICNPLRSSLIEIILTQIVIFSNSVGKKAWDSQWLVRHFVCYWFSWSNATSTLMMCGIISLHWKEIRWLNTTQSFYFHFSERLLFTIHYFDVLKYWNQQFKKLGK
jgi:hypothetical protein